MIQDSRFQELIRLIAPLCRPLGPFGTVEDFIATEVAALNALCVGDIPFVFDMIGYNPPRELWLTPDEFDSVVTLCLSTLAEKYPNQFLTTLEQRIGSIPTAMHLIEGAEDVARFVGRVICELAASRRCLSSVERALLKERCATIGCSCCFDAVLNPAWRTSDVLALARGIEDEKAFDRMPILADALQDAGCDNDDILNHCRDAKQVHVCGCWVVDIVLGKE